MSETKYCRREIEARKLTSLYCMNPIETLNALDWCNDCRKRLPLWPKDDSNYKIEDAHLYQAQPTQAHIDEVTKWGHCKTCAAWALTNITNSSIL